ncbi:hypothetical protein M8C21_026066 [Ambrosia artemisiifolia]|uniref:superoxide dismutase n=1 Tax=Ambrosia artemisiifolia TaxID=4212 RepID=A0AAD5BKZ6_AMBAR|nr:hypothetical protein M8C21_026066 [Ambrosia artemisiifolia]
MLDVMQDALEPHMSKETLEYHWGKHHRGYVNNLNKQIEGTELDEKSLESIILASYNKGDILPSFNNAAQIWNHEFFWESMKPGGGGKPSGELLELINRDFGSFEALIQEFKLAASTQFGSGWAWLVYDIDEKKLVVLKSSNAINPLVLGSYNLRPDYISTFLDKLVSWDAARKSVSGAMIDLKPPPYALDALEPYMSKETLEYHWGKHHRGYVNNLNKQIEGTEHDEKLLENIILDSYNKGDLLPAFNNAAQVWNHEFFWESMKPGGGGKPSGELLDLIIREFGTFEELIKQFKLAAATHFGSGWTWLVYDKEHKKLVVLKTSNAINPLVLDYYPLLTLDVWENLRPDYIATFLDKLVSWDAASSRLEAAKVSIEGKRDGGN